MGFVARLHPTLISRLHKAYEWKGKAVCYLNSHSSIRSMPVFKFKFSPGYSQEPSPIGYYYCVISNEKRMRLTLKPSTSYHVDESLEGKDLDQKLQALTEEAQKDNDYATKTVFYLYPLIGQPEDYSRVKVIAALVLPYRKCIKTSGATNCTVEPEDEDAQIITGSARSPTGAHGEDGYVIIARPDTKILVREERTSGTGRLGVSTQVIQL